MKKSVFYVIFLMIYIVNSKSQNYVDSVRTSYPGFPTELVGPYLQTPSSTSIFINWKTISSEESIVFYGTDRSNLDKRQEGTVQDLGSLGLKDYLYHTVHLTGLKPNTKYYYKVKSGSMESKVFQFNTQPDLTANNGIYRFMIFGDHQQKLVHDFEAMLTIARVHVEDLYKMPFYESINLIVNDGDQVDVGTLDHYENVHFGKMKEWCSNVPVITAVGNHETYQDKKLDNYSAHYCYDHLNYGPGTFGAHKEESYVFKVANIVFVSLGSEYWSKEKVDWTKRAINTVDKDSDVDWLISIHHRPPFSESYTTDIGHELYRKSVIPAFNKSPKHVMDITGHHHLYARGQYADLPAYHIISGAAAWTQHWDKGGDKGDHSLVQKTICKYTYQIVEIDLSKKELKVESYAVGDYYKTRDLSGPKEYYWEKIDEFHRKLKALKPNKPSIVTDLSKPVDLSNMFTIESSDFSTSESGEQLNTVAFQFSKTADFSEVAKQSSKDFENIFYEDTKTHTPLDQNAGINILKYDIPALSLANGTWYARVRHRDRNLEWSSWSNPVRFTVEGSEIDNKPRLTLDKNKYAFDEEIHIKYANGTGIVGSWIGLYWKDQKPGKSPSLAWSYLKAKKMGKLTLSVPSQKRVADGYYYATMFKDIGHRENTERSYFYIGDIAELSVSKKKYSNEEVVKIHVKNAPGNKVGNENDRIVVYRHGKQKKDAQKQVVAKTVLTNGEGTVNFSNLPDGFYYANYYPVDDTRTPVVPTSFRVGDQPTQVLSSKRVFKIGEDVPVFIEGGVDSGDDWVGIYPVTMPIDQPNSEGGYRYQYVYNPYQKLTFSGPNQLDGVPHTPGKYVLAYFPNSGYELVSNLYEFTVGYSPLNPDTIMNKVKQPIQISYVQDETWEEEIGKIYIDNQLVEASKYTVENGHILFDNTVFAKAGKFVVRVTSKSSRFIDATVVQEIFPDDNTNMFVLGADDTIEAGQTKDKDKILGKKEIIKGFNGKEISIYPNPTDGVIYLEGLIGDCRVKVTNASGKKVYSQHFMKSNGLVDLSSFESGVYIISLHMGSETVTRKIVKY